MSSITSFISNTVRVNHIIMTNKDGIKIDITRLVIGIDLFEDIYAPTLNGTIDIIDANDMLQFFPIIGEEKIRIDIILPGFSDDANFVLDNYRIHKITDRVVNSDKIQTYKLWFTSPEFITDFEKRISKAWYEKTTESMVKDAFGFLGSKKTLEIDPSTIGVHNFISTNFSPLQIIDYLASHRSINTNKLSDYMFFESFDSGTTKFNFKSLGYLSSTSNPIAEFTYRPVNVNNDSVGPSTNIQPYNIENITFKKGFDIIKAKSSGYYNQTFMYYDLLRKKYVVQKNTYDDVFNETKGMKIENAGGDTNRMFSENTETYGDNINFVYVSGFPSRISSTLDFSSTHNKSTEPKAKRGTNTYIAKKGLSSDKVSTLVEDTLYRRKILLHEFEINKINLNDISGNYEYTVGSVIEFNKPHIVVNKTEKISESGDSINDIFISGRYLITKSRHHIVRSSGLNWKYKNYLEVSKNTIKTSLDRV